MSSENPVIDNKNMEVGTKEILNLDEDEIIRTNAEYAGKLLISLNNQRLNNEYCDVKIKVKDVEFPCHKIILSGASPQLKGLLNSCKDGDILELQGVDAAVMGSILNFIYTGDTKISKNNVKDIFAAGEFFKMTVVQEAALEFLVSNVNVHNCLQLYIFAQLHNSTDLEKKAFLYAVNHFDKLWSSKDILDLSQQQLINFLGADGLRMKMEEYVIFLTAQRWFNKCLKKEADLLSIMKMVRFHEMDSNFLQTCLELFPVLKLYPEVTELIQKANKLTNVENFSQSEELLPSISLVTLSETDTVEVILLSETGAYRTIHFYCYVTESNEVYHLRNLCLPVNFYHSMACLNNQIYVLDGSVLWKSDEANNIIADAALGMNKLFHQEIVALDDHLYLVGFDHARVEDQFFISVLQCDLSAKSWTEVGNFNTQFSFSSVVGCNKSLYFAGGKNRRTDKIYKFLLRYCLVTKRYYYMRNMQFAREYAASCFLDGFIYIIGGNIHVDCYLNYVERYNIKKNCWETMAPMLKARACTNAVVKDGQIYVLGGYANGLVKEIERYDPLTDKWEIISEISFCPSYTNFRCATLKVPRFRLNCRV